MRPRKVINNAPQSSRSQASERRAVATCRATAGETWGKSIVGNPAGDLRKEFPGANGFSAVNLWRMKSFYEVYGQNEKLAQLVREIGWSHNIAILEKCKSEQEREFYIRTRTQLRRSLENSKPEQS
jgi:predicted nuclease of restriction endonuclease-like (RecB) superfamily